MPSPEFPIVDSHVHLYPEAEIPSLAWCAPDHPLAAQQSVEQYRTATGSPPNLRGLVLVESDRKNGGDGKDWSGPLAEVSWAARLAGGAKPRPGEGHTEADAALCLGIVIWAPVHGGAAVLERYLGEAKKAAGEAAWSRVRGVRYLVQDKPNGTVLADDFIAGLKLLGRRGLVFDVGVDQHRRGRIQLEETVDMIDRAHEDVPEEEKVVFIINHLCKPDLTVINPADPSFIAWRTAMFTLSKCARVYVKLSGLFAEMPDALKARPAPDIFDSLHFWFAVLLAAFGSSRIMFGSDWPVCTVGVGDGAWDKWRRVVERMCYMASLEDEDQAMLWGGTAIKAYGIESAE